MQKELLLCPPVQQFLKEILFVCRRQNKSKESTVGNNTNSNAEPHL